MSELSQHCIVVPADLRSSKRIVPPIDNLLDRRLEPVKVRRHVRRVGEGPIERIVEELDVGVDGGVGEERLGDEHRERAVARGGVQAGLGHGGAFRACDLGYDEKLECNRD